MSDERYIAAALRGVFVCGRCGTLVANDDRHDDWHRNELQFDAKQAQKFLAVVGYEIPLNDIREAIDVALGLTELGGQTR